MKIHVNREACCSQDDQLGPLDRWYELGEDCSLGEFIAAVMGSRFLQFSSTHTTMVCRVAGTDAATVFSPYLVPTRTTIHALPAGSVLRGIASGGQVDFTFVNPRAA